MICHRGSICPFHKILCSSTPFIGRHEYAALSCIVRLRRPRAMQRAGPTYVLKRRIADKRVATDSWELELKRSRKMNYVMSS
jgi:hypothetical protein